MRIKRYLILSGILFFVTYSWGQQLAFPSAEGYGKYTVGGRGGAVLEVTNLKDSGEGSLRAAIETEGPRTVVFKISGTIKLESNLRIKNPFITIAGQTAPGDGITLRGYPLLIDADEVIIRYLRVRLGDESGDDTDAITSRYTKNLILDHVSASWSVDETMSIYHGENVTVQWCIVSESLYMSNHKKGSDHGYGGIWGSNYSTYHHNLIASHSSRNPRFASGAKNVDYRNNVVYNWGYKGTYGGEVVQLKNEERFGFTNINMVANYYKPGPATVAGYVRKQLANPWSRNGEDDYGNWYIANNVMVGSKEVTADNWKGVFPSLTAIKNVQAYKEINLNAIPSLKLDEPWPAMPIKEETAEMAYENVLKNAGAILPKRDIIDLRIINETKSGTATFEGTSYKKQHKVMDPSKKTGIIDSQTEVGGWPLLKSLPAPKDNDHDGIADSWELDNGLDPANALDRNLVNTEGYTMLEVYLNSITN
ncbi:pectate lyase [Maribacter sedimenticola]|uniref:Pectate lyase n=1 Tax=Maribacter sedimenticola TaxID=228956 RepID=A0ABY1SEN3_9FLAO|nr:pectate lyase [Maribacter sedimenticola]SNR31102.1 pectate lyase [Maribacter sedimenticola]